MTTSLHKGEREAISISNRQDFVLIADDRNQEISIWPEILANHRSDDCLTSDITPGISYRRGCPLTHKMPRRPEVLTLGRKQGKGNEGDWRNAKKLCRLNTRQVAMARAIGMNPKKLPGLRPGPQERWKLPVGEFIEECYRKRFIGDPVSDESRRPEGEGRLTVNGANRPISQVQSLVCYFANLSADLEEWLVHGTIAPEVLVQVCKELRKVADALEASKSVSEMPEILLPPSRRSERSASRDPSEDTFEDDEIPF